MFNILNAIVIGYMYSAHFFGIVSAKNCLIFEIVKSIIIIFNLFWVCDLLTLHNKAHF